MLAEKQAAKAAAELAARQKQEAADDRVLLKFAACIGEPYELGSLSGRLEKAGLLKGRIDASLSRLVKRGALDVLDRGFWFATYYTSKAGFLEGFKAIREDDDLPSIIELLKKDLWITPGIERFFEVIAALDAIFKGVKPAPANATLYGWDKLMAGVGRRYLELGAEDERFRALLDWLPRNALKARVEAMQSYFDSTCTLLESDGALAYLAERFDDDPAVADWLLFHWDFLRRGNPEACVKRVKGGTAWGELMLGAAALYRGEAAAALEHMKKALLLAGRKRVFNNFAENWFYLAALYRDRANTKSLKKLQQIAETKKIAQSEETYWMWLLASEGGMLDYKRSSSAILQRFRNALRFEHWFAPYYILEKRLGAEFNIPVTQTSGLEYFAKSSPFFGVEAARLFPEKDAKQFLEAGRAAGLTPLLPGFERKAAWEEVLDRLLASEAVQTVQAKTGKTAAEGTGPGARVVYIIDVPSEDIEVIVQKTRNGINWSKGSAITLPAFLRGVDGMTTQDKAVASAVRQSDRRNGYFLAWTPAIEALVGSPNVYDAQTGAHIEVVREPLRIAVRRTKAGYQFETNLASNFRPGDALSVSAPEKGRVVVIRPTEQEQTLLKILQDAKDFPEQAAPKLTVYLEKLSKRTPVMSDLLKNSTNLKKVKGDARITFRIQPVEAGEYLATAVVHPLPDSPLACEPGRGLGYLAVNAKAGAVQVERSLAEEKKNAAILEEKLAALDERREEAFVWRLDVGSTLLLLETVREAGDIAAVEWPEGEKFRVQKAKLSPDALKLSLSRMGNWFEVEGKIRIDKKTFLSVAELLEKIRSEEGGFIRLSDTEYVALADSLRKQLALLDGFAGKGARGAVKVSVFNAGVIEGLEDAGVEVEADEACRAFVKRMNEARDFTPSVPKALRAELRSYQQEGFEWLARLAQWGAGALLADDMGLGKTVQAIALLVGRAQKGASLVVAPASVLFNWVDELKRFAPTLNPVVFNQEDRERVVKSAGPGDVVLATYGVLAAEVEKLSGPEWATLVLDEAHAIKNRETKTSKAAKRLKSDARVLLTGTPIQNHLSEIWNLFDVANPGLLGGFDAFGERFIVPVERDHDRGRQRLLKRLISPFILRRTKAEVLEELPQKTEITIRVELSQKERALYENLRETTAVNLAEGVINPIEALAELTKLRLAACHPALVNPKLSIESSKTKAFLGLVDDLQEGGHRALVFSQFTSHLALIRKALDEKGVEYLYLDGSVPAGERKKLADRFQKSAAPLFLISLKAGGTGLNLTGADFVIHLDPWWNPAIEDQASDRAYRIGQEKPVTIYRLVSENTIEEKILRLHETKKSLADALLEGSDVSSRLSRDEILKLLAGS